jgi:hypothetical protein
MRRFDSDPRLQFRFWSLTTGVGVVAFLSLQECSGVRICLSGEEFFSIRLARFTPPREQ